jgi:hypothetical protein
MKQARFTQKMSRGVAARLNQKQAAAANAGFGGVVRGWL